MGGTHSVKDRDGCGPLLLLSAGTRVGEILMVRLALVNVVEIVGKVAAPASGRCGWRGAKVRTCTTAHALQGFLSNNQLFLEKVLLCGMQTDSESN